MTEGWGHREEKENPEADGQRKSRGMDNEALESKQESEVAR